MKKTINTTVRIPGSIKNKSAKDKKINSLQFNSWHSIINRRLRRMKDSIRDIITSQKFYIGVLFGILYMVIVQIIIIIG